jgi:hypothetical protein
MACLWHVAGLLLLLAGLIVAVRGLFGSTPRRSLRGSAVRSTAGAVS